MDLSQLGTWVRTSGDDVRFHTGPSEETLVLRELERHTPLRVWGGTGSRFRVALPNGISGFVDAAVTEPAREPLEVVQANGGSRLRDRPAMDASVIAELSPGAKVDVLARYGQFLWIRQDQGPIGWLPKPKGGVGKLTLTSP